jgi:Na+/proline symporter
MPEQAQTLIAEDPQRVLPTLVVERMPFFMQIMFFGALLSAIKSCASATLLAPSVTFTENIWRQFYPNPAPAQELRAMRVTVLVFSVLVLGYAILMQGTSIYEMVSNAYQIPLVGAFIPLTFGLYWRRATTQGAVASIVLGLGCWAVFTFFPYDCDSVFSCTLGDSFPAQLAGLMASLLGMLAGSLLPQWMANRTLVDRELTAQDLQTEVV